MKLEVEHGINCECGQTFQNPEELAEHVAIEQVIEEIKRIAGEKFSRQVRNWEDDAHSGNIREFVESHDFELVPENATEIAKKEICHMVRHHDEYHMDEVDG